MFDTPSPFRAFYEEAELAAPVDIDKAFLPILINAADSKARIDNPYALSEAELVQKRKLSLAVAVHAILEISSVVRSVMRQSYPDFDFFNDLKISNEPTAPKDGVNLIQDPKGKPVLIATLRGDRLAVMAKSEIFDLERQIYKGLGKAVRAYRSQRAKTAAAEFTPV